MCAGHDGAGDWDKEDAYEAQLRKERGEPEVPDLGHAIDGTTGLPLAIVPHPAALWLMSLQPTSCKAGCRLDARVLWRLAHLKLLCTSAAAAGVGAGAAGRAHRGSSEGGRPGKGS